MDLADRVRRSLGLGQSSAGATADRPPQERQRRLEQLRRAIARVQSRPARALAPRPPAPHDVIEGDNVPESVDEAGTLYREHYAAGHRLGAFSITRPDRDALERLVRLLALCGERAGEGEPLEPEDLLFIDTETTGLSRAAGTLAFLVGVGLFDAEGFRVDQLFLRDPADEPIQLERLQQHLQRARVLVSFNGRAFDLPILRNRAMIARVPLALDRPHLDLLPLCRRLFRHRTSNCRLGTLEREILGFERVGDIDGSEAPLIYAHFLGSGHWGRLGGVLQHNSLDVAAMAPLLLHVADHFVDPLHWAEDGDELMAVAEAHLRRGDFELPRRCLERGLELARGETTRRRLLMALARLHRRREDRAAAAAVWERYRQAFPRCNTGWVELAKYHEHVTGDLSRALTLAEQAPQADDAVAHRRKRLQGRIARRDRR